MKVVSLALVYLLGTGYGFHARATVGERRAIEPLPALVDSSQPHARGGVFR